MSWGHTNPVNILSVTLPCIDEGNFTPTVSLNMSKFSHVSAHWQLNFCKDINWKEGIETFSLEGKEMKVT